MRVCELHRVRAVRTLRDIKDATEYDLCAECLNLLAAVLNGETDNGRVGPVETTQGAAEPVAKRVPTRGRPRKSRT